MSALISKTSLIALAGVAGTLFVSYCFYFDHKRRSDPDFKKKLRDSMFISHLQDLRISWLILCLLERKSRKKTSNSGGSTNLPDLKDHEAVQQFFLHEVCWCVASFDSLIQHRMYGTGPVGWGTSCSGWHWSWCWALEQCCRCVWSTATATAGVAANITTSSVPSFAGTAAHCWSGMQTVNF